jgi:hypothetical protein
MAHARRHSHAPLRGAERKKEKKEHGCAVIMDMEVMDGVCRIASKHSVHKKSKSKGEGEEKAAA